MRFNLHLQYSKAFSGVPAIKPPTVALYEKVVTFHMDSLREWLYNISKTNRYNRRGEQHMENAGNFYLIKHLVMFTGLTERTIRSYLASGILRGEKINGLWHFSPEQVEAFICHPAVRPSILTKNHAAVYDFLLANKKENCEMCLILDIPGSKKEIAEYFCYRISNEDFHNIQFSFDGVAKVPRVILKGAAEEVLRLVNGFMQNKNTLGH